MLKHSSVALVSVLMASLFGSPMKAFAAPSCIAALKGDLGSQINRYIPPAQNPYPIITRKGFVPRNAVMGLVSMKPVLVHSVFSPLRDIEVQMTSPRGVTVDKKMLEKLGSFTLKLFQTYLQSYEKLGFEFPKSFPSRFNFLYHGSRGKNPMLLGQKRWRIQIPLDAREEFNANIMLKNTYMNFLPSTTAIDANRTALFGFALRHEMGHTLVAYWFPHENRFPHFRAFNEGIADFLSWYTSDNRVRTQKIIEERRDGFYDFNESVQFADGRKIHEGGSVVTQFWLKLHSLWTQDLKRSETEFTESFIKTMNTLEPIVHTYQGRFHLYHFFIVAYQQMVVEAKVPVPILDSLFTDLKITELEGFQTELVNDATKRMAVAPLLPPAIYGQNDDLLNFGEPYKVPGRALLFHENPKDWHSGKVFDRLNSKLWIDPNGVVFMIEAKFNRVDKGTYEISFELFPLPILSWSQIIFPSSLITGPLLTVKTSDGTLKYKIYDRDQNHSAKDFSATALNWFMKGVGGQETK